MHRSLFVIAIVFVAMLSQQNQAQAFCFEEAGKMYGISPQLLWVISKGESNFNPAAVGQNKNGTYDYGLMQINTSWAPTLKRHGIQWQSLADPCTNVKVGAWILAQCFKEYGYTWQGVGCYNSRTPLHRNRYANRIARILEEVRKHPPQPTVVASANSVQMEGLTPWEIFLPDDSK